jgi:hypothetical protein
MLKVLILSAAVLCLTPVIAANLTTSEAKSHVGDTATVCQHKGPADIYQRACCLPHQAFTGLIRGINDQLLANVYGSSLPGNRRKSHSNVVKIALEA